MPQGLTGTLAELLGIQKRPRASRGSTAGPLGAPGLGQGEPSNYPATSLRQGPGKAAHRPPTGRQGRPAELLGPTNKSPAGCRRGS